MGGPLKFVRELGALGPLALFMVLGPALGALVLVATSAAWFEALAGLGPATLPCFLLATTLLAGLSLVPTHAASLVGGMLFGATFGSALALLGIAAAACLGYLVLRSLTLARTLASLERRPRAAAVHRALLQRGAAHTLWLIVLIRLSPVMPFAGTNLLLAATGVRLRVFLSGSMLGLAPRVVVVAVAGAGLAELDLTRAADARLAALGVVATLVVLLVIGRVARRALREASG